MELTFANKVQPALNAAQQQEQAQPARQVFSPLSATAAVATLGIAGDLVYFMTGVIQEFVPPMAIFAAVGVLASGTIATGWRWAPTLASVYAALLSILLVGPAAGELAHALGQPSDPMYTVLVVLFPLLAVAIVTGIAATAQNYRVRAGARRAPRYLAASLAAVAGIAAGALIIGAFPRPAATAGVSPEVLATLPSLKTKGFVFEQAEIRVKAGETVAFRLENADTASHSFDIDELGVHAPMAAGQTSFALFKPTTPGTYTFYCAPHFDKASGQGMKGTLVVE